MLARTIGFGGFKNLTRSMSTAHKTVQSLAVIGSGQMGIGIAYTAAANAKVPVTLIDNAESSLTVGKSFIEKLINKNLSKGKLTEAEAKEIESRINTTTSLTKGIRNVDMIIEAVPEIPKLKYEIFAQLAKEAKSDAILATNTSSISITKIAACAKGAESRVIGAHFMNPVPIQKGVEIIQGLQTSEETLARTTEFTTRMNKVTSVAQDSPGFLANRILIPYVNEAVIALETGIGKKEDIDNIMKNGCAMPMGPLQLADFVGLDTCLAIINVLYQNTGDSKYRPSVLLTKMVDAGYLGVKSGKGFYDYPQKGAKL